MRTTEPTVNKATAVLDRDALIGVLKSVAPAVSKRTSLPVLSDVLVEILVERIRITATNLEFRISEYLPLTTENAGALCVPFKWFTDALKVMPKGNVTIEIEGDRFHLYTGATRETAVTAISVTCETEENFPPEGADQFEASINLGVNPELFLRQLKAVAAAAGTDENRPVLTAVSVELEDGVLTLMATDSRIAAVRQLEVGGARVADNFKVLVPAHVAKVIINSDGSALGISLPPRREVGAAVGRWGGPSRESEFNRVRFTCGRQVVFTRTIDGSYPNVLNVIPKHDVAKPTIVTGRPELIAAIARVASVLAEDNAGRERRGTPDVTPISLSAGDLQRIVLSARSSAGATAREELPIDWRADSSDVVIGFAPWRILGALKGLEGSHARFYVDSPLSPVIVRGEADADYTIVMPARIAPAK